MQSRSCPYCNAQIGEYTIKCPNCNSKLKTICKKCKKIVDTNWTECPDCGSKIYHEDITPILKDDKKQERETQIYSEFTPNLDTNIYDEQNEEGHSVFYPIETKTQIYSDSLPGEVQEKTNELSKNSNAIKIMGAIFGTLAILLIVSFAMTPDAEDYYNDGYSLYSAGRYTEAIAKFDKALELDPKYLDAWILKGIALYNEDRYSEAIDCYNKAIGIDPNNPDIWWNKGKALYRLDRKVEANECFDKAKELGYKG